MFGSILSVQFFFEFFFLQNGWLCLNLVKIFLCLLEIPLTYILQVLQNLVDNFLSLFGHNFRLRLFGLNILIIEYTGMYTANQLSRTSLTKINHQHITDHALKLSDKLTGNPHLHIVHMHQLNYQRTLNLGIVMSVQPNFNIKPKYTHLVNVSLSLN